MDYSLIVSEMYHSVLLLGCGMTKKIEAILMAKTKHDLLLNVELDVLFASLVKVSSSIHPSYISIPLQSIDHYRQHYYNNHN